MIQYENKDFIHPCRINDLAWYTILLHSNRSRIFFFHFASNRHYYPNRRVSRYVVQSRRFKNYYRLATTSIYPLIATEAFRHLSLINTINDNMSKAYDDYTSYLDALQRKITNEEGRILQAKYQEEKLQNELNTIRIAKQNRNLWIIALNGILLLLSTFSYILYNHHQRRRKEKNMKRESERLNQENKLLKQTEELRTLREKKLYFGNLYSGV